jgi:hypothetical protein
MGIFGGNNLVYTVLSAVFVSNVIRDLMLTAVIIIIMFFW